jgi:hypothetical protein
MGIIFPDIQNVTLEVVAAPFWCASAVWGTPCRCGIMFRKLK